MAEVRKMIAHMNDKEAAGFATDEGLVGGSAYDAHGQAISDATWKRRWPPTRCCSAPSADRNGTRAL
jgi:isocitrate/isopropylmalate dehydrogenase